MAEKQGGAGNGPATDWEAAVAAQQSGNLPEAIAFYRKVTAAAPQHADAHANLASCLRASGDLAGALTAFGKALALQPKRADILFNLGNAQRAAGDLQGAVEAFGKAVKQEPRLGPAWLNLGLVLRVLERDDEALEALDRAAALLPKLAQAYSERGSVLRKLGRPQDAVESHRKAVALAPDDPQSLYNLANALADCEAVEEARSLYERALSMRPDFAEALVNLAKLTPPDAESEALQQSAALLERAVAARPDLEAGVIALAQRLEQLDRWPAARAQFVAALERKPESVALLRSFAQACARQGEPAEAAELAARALACEPESDSLLAEWAMALRAVKRGDEAREPLEAAVARSPDTAILRRCLGILHVDAERMDEAMAELEAALQLDPDDSQAHMALTNALLSIGRLGDARKQCEEVLARQPDLAAAHSFNGFALVQQGHVAEAMAAFERAAEAEETPDAHLSNLLFAANYRDDTDPAELATLHRRFGEAVRVEPLPAPRLGGDWDADPDRRLRVGYVSPDLRAHSVAAFFEPLLTAHDRDAVEPVCYANLPKADAVTERLKQQAALWRDVDGLEPQRLAELIREDRIDILVDLAGHTAKNSLRAFAYRPAPVQATYIGYPNSTGMPEIDYRLVDGITDPPGDGDEHYVEHLVRLPRCFLAYGPIPTAPAVQSLPANKAGHVTFGSFNTIPKLTPSAVKLWARVLSAVPDSRLLLKALSLGDPETQERMLALFAAEGIDASRIELLAYVRGQAEHLALYGRLDIALDSFPYNGTTTTCEALWMGVPVLTLQGDRHAGRVGSSLLRAAGLDELIADDADDFLAKASALATDLPRLASLRQGLRQRLSESPLCDATALARAVETAYRTMWHSAVGKGGDAVEIPAGEKTAPHVEAKQKSQAPKEAPASTEAEPDYQKILALMASDFGEAERQIEAAAERWPSSLRAQLTLAFLRNFRKDSTGAIEALRRALEIEPNSAMARFNLGYCLERLGKLDEALAQYQAAAEPSGSLAPDAETQAAACLHRLGRIEEAAAGYGRVLRARPNAVPALYGLLRVRREADDREKAEDAAERLRDLFAEQPQRAAELVSWLNRYDFHGWSALDDKAALLAQVTALRAEKGDTAFPYLPETFLLPEQQAAMAAAHRSGDVWILKPAALFGGQGVRLIDDPAAAPQEPGWLAQRYIADPLLLQERKFHLRLYLLVAGVAPPRLALWHDGVVRFAVEPYRLEDGGLDEIERHVTNSVRFQDHPGMRLSRDPEKEDEGNVWSLSALLERLGQSGGDPRAALSELATGVARLIDHAGLLAAQREEGRRFAYPPKLLGLDVLLDGQGRPWLLEIEAFPALAGGAAAVVGRLHERLFRSTADIAIAAGEDAADDDDGLWKGWQAVSLDRPNDGGA